MDTDEAATIDDPEDAAWVAKQRQTVIDYLTGQGCDHNGVSSRAKELAPLLKSRAALLQEFGEELNKSETAGEG